MNAERHTIRPRPARFDSIIDEVSTRYPPPDVRAGIEARIYMRLMLLHLRRARLADRARPTAALAGPPHAHRHRRAVSGAR